MKVYILVKESGSYSDYTMTNVAVYLHSDKAELAKKELEAELELIKRAKDENYKNINQWTIVNPPPKMPDYRLAKKDKVAYNAQYGAYKDWNSLRVEEEKRFYNSLDYLTSEQKTNLVEHYYSYYETDASYSIEEFSLIE